MLSEASSALKEFRPMLLERSRSTWILCTYSFVAQPGYGGNLPNVTYHQAFVIL